MQTEFLFYGCWNRIDCESDDTPYRYRDIVLDYIDTNETDIKDFYIAGDNWYPNMLSKEQPTEYYFTNILKSGYDRIYGLQKNTYIVLGNHDEVSMDQTDLKTKTCMLNTQRYYLDNITDTNVITPTLELLHYKYNKQETPVLRRHNSLSLPKTQRTLPRQKSFTLSKHLKSRPKIMLYDDIDSVIKPNYIMIFINTNKIHNDGYLKNLESYIKDIKKLHEKFRAIFVMGHLPIMYFRYKAGTSFFRQMKTEDKKSDDEKNKDIKDLYNILVDNNCIYLCADTHCFEIMNIQDKTDETKTLVQIVAGTGGGEPDEVQHDNADFVNKSGNDNTFVSSYNITGSCVNSYGYAKIDVNNVNSENKILVHYIKVVPHNDNVLNKLEPKQFTYSIIKTDGKWIYKQDDNKVKLLESKKFDPNVYKKDELCNLNKKNVVYNSEGKQPCFEKKKEKKEKKETQDSKGNKEGGARSKKER